MFLKLLNPPPLLRGFPKAQSLELNLDTRSNQLLQNNHLCPAERQPKVGPLEHPPVLKLAILRKAKRSNPSVLVDKTKSAEIGSTFFTPDSPTNEPIIVSDKSEEEEDAEKDKDAEDTSVPPPLRLKELKQHVRDMEIELPRDLVEIPTKLETFTSTISSLSSQVAELKNIQWKLPAEFSTMVGNASRATSMHVPSAGQAVASPAEGEKNTKDAASVVEVPSISALQVLRKLGIIFTSVYVAVQKLKKDSWLELQFSLSDNSKLNVVYLLNRS
ncbi:hypothetical protein Tco_0467595 [Tanacetum coccineum]